MTMQNNKNLIRHNFNVNLFWLKRYGVLAMGLIRIDKIFLINLKMQK